MGAQGRGGRRVRGGRVAGSAWGLSSLGAVAHPRAEESLALGAEDVDIQDRLIQEEQEAWTGASII